MCFFIVNNNAEHGIIVPLGILHGTAYGDNIFNFEDNLIVYDLENDLLA